MATKTKKVPVATEADVMPAPAPAPIQPEPILPWLDCDGNELLEGDMATVLPDVSKRLSGKLVKVLGDYDPQKKSVQVEPVGWEGDDFGILLCYLKRLPDLGENLKQPLDEVAPAPSAQPELEMSIAAWNLLERTVRDGELLAHAKDFTQGAELNELQSAGLVELLPFANGSTYKPTAAGIAEIKSEQTEPAPAPSPAAKQKLTPAHFTGILDTAAAGLRVVSIDSIVVTTNTRKVFDETALAELAESVKAHGILQPIVLRPHSVAGQYELVAGGRRYRAAQSAGLAEVPATVRNLTDREFLEVQLLENLQRVDVRPADEAHAFAELLKNGFPLEEIAAKVGKPARFVAERARLMELLPEWVDALQHGRLLIGSAQQLARLTRAQQTQAHQQLDAGYGDKVEVAGVMRRLYSAADIRNYIERQFKTHDLEQAAFPKDDATLYPVAGACLTCPKRTGNTPYLFDEMGGNICLDGGCFGEKVTRYVARMSEQLATNGQPVLKVADHWSRVPADVLNLNKFKNTNSFPDALVDQFRAQGRVRPALMTEGARAGQIVEVVLDAAVASQPDVVAAIKQEKAKETQKEKDDAAKVRALGAARRQAYYQLTADVHGQGIYTAVLLRRMLLSDLQYGPHKAVREMLQQVYGWGEMSTRTYMDESERKQLIGYLAEMETPALQSLLLDLQLITWLHEEHPSNLPALCKELGWSDEQLLAAHSERKQGQKQEVAA